VFALALVFTVRQAAREPRRRLARTLAMAMFVLFVVQGLQASAPLEHRAMTLSGGDDWLAYEARAREVETGGLLMPFGKPLFQGDAFYYYPGYSYFLAAVHKMTGEDLSGPIFVHFLLLFVTNVVVYRTARKLFDERSAIGAVFLLTLIEELAFIRHYTVILLSENLYIVTVAWMIAALVGFIESGRRSRIAWAGLAAGISSLVRPVMMLYFVPAILIVLFAAHRHRPGAWAAARAALLFGACWIGVTLLATVRNYLVAGDPVFIVISPAHQFILDNLPANGQGYMRLYTSGLGSAVHVLSRIAIEHPYELARGVLTKVGFSLGWLQLMGGKPHPELLAASAGYLLALAAMPSARAFATWPVHAFVLAHLAGMVLRMPTLYGYRLILPLYLFFPVFASAMIADAARRIFLVPRVRPA
jgi:Dolichyl-phosphate-mannose-protein mannosyltransferase